MQGQKSVIGKKNYSEIIWPLGIPLTVTYLYCFLQQLRELAEKLDKTSLDFDTQCSDKDLTYAVLRELQTHGKKHKLEKFEIPGGVTMVKEIWDPESGLVTAAFKLKRKPLQVSSIIIYTVAL